MLHGHWRSCTIESHRRVLPSLAASRPVVASSPFRISGNCSRKSWLKHGFARPRRCTIGPCVPMCAIGRQEPPGLHGHWRSCTMAPHCMALPWLAVSRLFVASSMWRILRAYDGAPLHLSVQLFAIRQREPPVLHGHWRSCPMAAHCMALPWFAAPRPVVASSSFVLAIVTFICVSCSRDKDEEFWGGSCL